MDIELAGRVFKDTLHQINSTTHTNDIIFRHTCFAGALEMHETYSYIATKTKSFTLKSLSATPRPTRVVLTFNLK